MKLLLAIVLLLSSVCVIGQTSHSFSDLDSLMASEERLAVIFLHTDWCRYCQKMKRTTFQNERVKQMLDDSFYFISFNAETTETINYRGRSFAYKPTGNTTGVHALAEQLGTVDGQLNYPTLVVLSPANEILFQHGGVLNKYELIAVLEELNEELK